MDCLTKLMAMHKVIMNEILGQKVMSYGMLNNGWNPGEHIQHTSDTILNQIIRFQRQLDVVFTDIETQNIENISRSLTIFENDKTRLQSNIATDGIDKGLYTVVMEYINALSDTIRFLKLILEENN